MRVVSLLNKSRFFRLVGAAVLVIGALFGFIAIVVDRWTSAESSKLVRRLNKSMTVLKPVAMVTYSCRESLDNSQYGA